MQRKHSANIGYTFTFTVYTYCMPYFNEILDLEMVKAMSRPLVEEVIGVVIQSLFACSVTK